MGIMTNVFAVIMSVVLDWVLEEPKKFHPLVGFGKLANLVERLLNRKHVGFLAGLFAWCLLVLPLVYLVYLLDQYLNDKGNSSVWLNVLFGWLALGSESLQTHGRAVYRALQAGYLTEAQRKTSQLVSRETHHLDEEGLSRATIESILENGCDAVIAPMFYLLIGGAPLVVFYRLSNTLDAMWGYRTPRFEKFGKTSARIDDLLNYIPARITALLYALSGKTTPAIKAWSGTGKQWYSPNAGIVMAAGAGALELQLGGDAVYHGEVKKRPLLGVPEQAKRPLSSDIESALTLLRRCERLFLLSIFLIALLWMIYLKPHILVTGFDF